MATEKEVEFIFHNDGTNQTLVLYGQVDLTPAQNDTNEITSEEYDSKGALFYLVAVIVVYGISMFLIVATLIRRKSAHKSLDGQVDQYIKGLEAAREQAKAETVLRTRLRWPGNFIHFEDRNSYDSDSSTSTTSQNDINNVQPDMKPQVTIDIQPTESTTTEAINETNDHSTTSQTQPRAKVKRYKYKRDRYRKRYRQESSIKESSYESDSDYIELPATTLENKFRIPKPENVKPVLSINQMKSLSVATDKSYLADKSFSIQDVSSASGQDNDSVDMFDDVFTPRCTNTGNTAVKMTLPDIPKFVFHSVRDGEEEFV